MERERSRRGSRDLGHGTISEGAPVSDHGCVSWTTMQRRWISEGVAEDTEAEDKDEVLSRLPRHSLRRQTSENIATENESQENINLSWNAPEFYKRLKRLQRRTVEVETWNPNRWASCPEVVNPSLNSLTQDVRFYVGTSPSGRSINEDEEQYKTYLYYLLNTTRSASSELRFLELFQEAQDNIRAFQRQDSNCTLDIKPVRTAQSGTSWSSGVNDVHLRDRGFDAYHKDDVVNFGKTPGDVVGGCSGKSWSSSVGEVYSRHKVLNTYRQGDCVTHEKPQVLQEDQRSRTPSSTSVDNDIFPKKLSPKCDLQREEPSPSTGTLQVGNELCIGSSLAADVPAVIPTVCLQLETRKKVVSCVPGACEAYDNPCYETGGSPRCSFVDDASSQCRVGQPAGDGISADNLQCGLFSPARVKELLRYVFCCECHWWSRSKVQQSSHPF